MTVPKEALTPEPARPATAELRAECSACAGDECADLTCPKSLRPCGHHCNCVMVHDHCHWCDEEWGEDVACAAPTRSRGRSMADQPATAASDERGDVVVLIECQQVTLDEYQQIVNALQQSMIPLGLAEKLRMHAAINDCAERVMEAFDGT